MFTWGTAPDAHERHALPTIQFFDAEILRMSWRNGPNTRPPGSEGEHDRLPRAIAARLMRAGRLVDMPPPASTPEADRSRPPEAPASVPARWTREVFELIEWRRFEAVVEALFAQAGFETRSQAHGADGGVDIWLYSVNHDDSDAPVSIVQCKQWMRRKVGVKEVRELRGVMAQHGIARGQFVTTSDFTADAREFAAGSGIGLHDVDGLLRLIATRDAKQQEALLGVAFEGEWWRPTCASCGIKLVERTTREGGRSFWGCENYPEGCRIQLPIRLPYRGGHSS
jgi:restriction system protein